jgi:hypothetical protein
MQPDTRYARSGDIHVAYQVTGEGLVDLVMAPGTASHLYLDWEWPEKADFLKRLGSFCRLIRFDSGERGFRIVRPMPRRSRSGPTTSGP